MSEDDKLAKPSFEPMDAGIEFSSAAFHPSASVLSTALDYETAYIDFDAHDPTRPDTRLQGIGIDHAVLGVLAGRGAAAKASAAPRRAAGREDPLPREPRPVHRWPRRQRDTFATEPAVKLGGAAGRALMLAEQRVSPQAVRVQMVEAFELA